MELKQPIALSVREILLYPLTTQQELQFKDVFAVALFALTFAFAISEAP